MPRPHDGVAYLHCRLDPELRRRLDAAADDRDVSRNKIVCRAVEAWLNEHEDESSRLDHEIREARRT